MVFPTARKGVSPLVAYVLLVGIIISATGIIISIGLPAIENMRDTATIQESLNVLTELDSAIRETSSGGTYTSRNFQLVTRDGDYFIDEEDNSIIFEIETDSNIIQRHTFQEIGPVILTSDSHVAVYEASIDGEECYMMENDYLKACVAKKGSANELVEIDNSELLIHYEHKEIGDLNPEIEVLLNEEEDSVIGDGHTFPENIGKYLPEGSVTANMEFDGIQYDINFKLYSNSDFLKIDVNNLVVAEYTLEYVAEEGGYIEGEEIQTVVQGEDGELVTAQPEEGYSFVEWSDGVTDQSRQETEVIEDQTYTAEFELEEPEEIYDLIVNIEGEGTVEDNYGNTFEDGDTAEYPENTEVTLTANPQSNWKFGQWTGDCSGTNKECEITIKEDKEITAEFEEKTFVYSASRDDELHKINPDGTGTEWEYTEHEDTVFDVAVDQNGYVYSGSVDNEVHKIDPNGNQVWRYTEHEESIYKVSVDQNGYVYSASDDDEVHKIGPNGNQVWEYAEHESGVSGIAVDQDGYVYSASYDNELHKIKPDGTLEWAYTEHESGVLTVAVDQDGYVYSGSGGDEVHKIGPNGNQVWEYAEHESGVSGIAVDQDGYVYSASYDDEVHKIDPNGNQVWEYAGHWSSVVTVAVDKDGYVYSGSLDSSVHKIKPDGTLEWEYTEHEDYVWGVAVDPGLYGAGFWYEEEPETYELNMEASPAEGGTATDQTNNPPYTEETTIDITAQPEDGYGFSHWTTTAGNIENENNPDTTFTMPDEDVTVTANFEEEFGGHHIYSGSADEELHKISPLGNNIWVYDDHEDEVNTIAVDEDGYVYLVAYDHSIHKIDSDGNEIWVNEDFDDMADDIAVDKDGYIYIALLSDNGEIHKLDSDGNEIWVYDGHDDWVRSITVDTEGYVYSGSRDEEVHKIDSDGNNVWVYNDHSNAIRSLSVDKNGYVYSGSYNDGELHKINPDGNNIWVYDHPGYHVYGNVLDADGYIYTATSSEVHKIDSDGNNIWVYDEFDFSLLDIGVDPDGYIYAGGAEFEVHKIDFDGNNIWVYEGHSSIIRAIAVEPGRYSASFWDEEPETYELTISSDTGGSTSPSEGTHTHQEEEYLHITASSDSGYEFTGWSGDCDQTDGDACAVTMTEDKNVHANFEEEGPFEWESEPFSDVRINDIAFDSDHVYTVGHHWDDAAVTAYDPENDEMLWRHTWLEEDGEDAGIGAVGSDEDNVYIGLNHFSDGPSKIVAYDRETGVRQWDYITPESDGNHRSFQEIIVKDGMLYYAEFFNGEVFAFDIDNQEIDWSVEHYEGSNQETDGRVRSLHKEYGVLHVGISKGLVYGIDPDNGQKLWDYHIHDDLVTDLDRSGDVVYSVSYARHDEDPVAAYDLSQEEKLWGDDTYGTDVYTVRELDGIIYYGDRGNTITAYDPEDPWRTTYHNFDDTVDNLEWRNNDHFVFSQIDKAVKWIPEDLE